MSEEIKSSENQENMSNIPMDENNQQVENQQNSDNDVESKNSKEYVRYNLEEELEKIDGLDVEGVLDYFENDLIANLSEYSNISLVGRIVKGLEEVFNKKYKEYISSKKQQFVEEGGRAEDYKPSVDDKYFQEKFEELLNRFLEIQKEYYRKRAEYQQKNYEKKLEIIEKIKELPKSSEKIGVVYKKFKELMWEWKKTGGVHSSKYRDLMSRFDLATKMFYEYLEINRELMEMDRQKNYEEKLLIVEAAENLPYETLPIKSFNELQDLHKRWKEIGPVPREVSDKLWERFKEVSRKINDAYSNFFKDKKKREQENLKKKTELCEKAEAIADGDYKRVKEWKEKKDELLLLDQEWRKVGRVPVKYNDSIYERFRAAFDKFFDKKRKFFEHYDDLLKENLDKKLKLIEKVEALKDSEDWKKTTSEIIDIQKEWKEIGPVPQEESEKIWEQFRAACNYFFDRREKYYESLKGVEEENYKKKQELIEEMKAFESTGNAEKDMEAINAFVVRWNTIGFVPIEKKNEINDAYSNALKQLYEKANIDENKKILILYEQKVKDKKDTKGFQKFVNNEYFALNKRIKELERQVTKMENNLAFFSSTDNEFLKDIRSKIEEKRQKMKLLSDKLNILKKYNSQ